MRQKMVISLVLTAVTLAVFWQVGTHGFITLDDPDYITNNPVVQGGLTPAGFSWALTDTYTTGNWHPLTWLSHMADCQMYGLNPAGHHLTNVILHIINTVLLFLALSRLTGALWRGAFVAALFALHPLHVESVAWAAERKDLLSTLFWMLTLYLYAGYVASPGRIRYTFMVIAFALGLMAKPMLVTLPFVLLLLDYWPLGRYGTASNDGSPGGRKWAGPVVLRFRSLVREKLPLLGLSVMFCLVALYAQQHARAAASLATVTFPARIVNAVCAYGRYIAKTVWPKNLAIHYPLTGTAALPAWPCLGWGLLLLGVTFLVLCYGRRRPYLIVGWLWFLGTLVPVIGLVQVGTQSMADRYTYVPLIGLFIMAAWGGAELAARLPWRRTLLGAIAAVILGSLALVTVRQIGYWRDSITLFTHALQVEPLSDVAHYCLGIALDGQQRYDEALEQYRAVLKIDPSFENAHLLSGIILLHQGDTVQAVSHFSEELRLHPDSEAARSALDLVRR
jgi:tetratricopeptide (TPR) repeat protein